MKTIIQKVKFKASPKEVYSFYMDAKKHAEITDHKTVIQPKVGTTFSAYNGYITGKNLHLVPGKMVVQSWRGRDWSKKDKDSSLILAFERVKGGTSLMMVHANVPDDRFKALTKGWKRSYWKRWQKYLSQR